MSGFFFCGIRDEPVVYASAILMKLNSALAQRITSSARRERCTASSAARGAEFDHEIAVAHGIHGILREPRPAVGVHETEQARHQFAVQRQRGAGEGAAAQRADVHARMQSPSRSPSRSSIST